MKQVSLQTCSSSGMSVNALCLLYVQHDAHTKDREAGELLQRGAERLGMGLSEVQSQPYRDLNYPGQRKCCCVLCLLQQSQMLGAGNQAQGPV